MLFAKFIHTHCFCRTERSAPPACSAIQPLFAGCDLRGLLLRQMDHAVAAITSCQIAVIPHQKLLEMIERHPGLGFGLWADTMLDRAICERWLTNIGRLPAHARIAHLLCELFTRLQAIGRADHGSFELPLTQTDIGDAMGLSTVHVNRTLQQLRAEGLITLHSNVLVVRDWRRLRAAAEFDPSYLFCKPGGRPRMHEPA